MKPGLIFCRVLAGSERPPREPNTPNSKYVPSIPDQFIREVNTCNGVQWGEMACNLVQWHAIKLAITLDS
jgi:hypothetical protein